MSAHECSVPLQISFKVTAGRTSSVFRMGKHVRLAVIPEATLLQTVEVVGVGGRKPPPSVEAAEARGQPTDDFAC
jgi:hypothetical protein